MKRQCFTCSNKESTELTQEQRKEMRNEEIAKGARFPRIPEMIFHCKVTGKRISQIDPACQSYNGDDNLLGVRKMISETASKLREEL